MALDASTVSAHHRRRATSLLLRALHYHRFFGQPLAALSAAHNAARAEVNDRTVRSYAEQAGQYAYYAGVPVSDWDVTHPEATTVELIRDAMGIGWRREQALLASEAVA